MVWDGATLQQHATTHPIQIKRFWLGGGLFTTPNTKRQERRLFMVVIVMVAIVYNWWHCEIGFTDVIIHKLSDRKTAITVTGVPFVYAKSYPF